MFLDLNQFTAMSTKIHPDVLPIAWSTIYSRAFILNDNKEIARVVKKTLNENNFKISLQGSYEYLSKLAGYKSWNVASSLKIQFKGLFRTESSIIDLLETLNENKKPNKFSSLIRELDVDMIEGFRRGSLSCILTKANSSGIYFNSLLGSNFLKQDLTVVHFPKQEEKEKQKIYLMNLIKSNSLHLIKNLALMESTFRLFEKCEEIYNSSKFDVLIFEQDSQFLDERNLLNLKLLSEKLNCIVILSISGGRMNPGKPLSSHDFSNIRNLSRMPHNILSVNVETEDGYEIYLEKSSFGPTRQVYSIKNTTKELDKFY